MLFEDSDYKMPWYKNKKIPVYPIFIDFCKCILTSHVQLWLLSFSIVVMVIEMYSMQVITYQFNDLGGLKLIPIVRVLPPVTLITTPSNVRIC